ncbi:MAG: hypothetical protein OEV73_00225 [Desulfobulbaceae bacterium]|nr:hypothetical protein [Desulfobulbaceae bacterium]
MSDEPAITHEYDDRENYIAISVDGKKVVEWWCEQDPEDMVREFKKVFDAGVNFQKQQTKA